MRASEDGEASGLESPLAPVAEAPTELTDSALAAPEGRLAPLPVRIPGVLPGIVIVIVIDEAGTPVPAEVRAVPQGMGGPGERVAFSNPDDDTGLFRFRAPRHRAFDRFVLVAEHQDGTVAVSKRIRRDRSHPVVLRLAPGARVEVLFGGEREAARCALFRGGLRIADLELENGVPLSRSVPAGAGRARYYSVVADSEVVEEERDYELAVGAAHAIEAYLP